MIRSADGCSPQGKRLRPLFLNRLYQILGVVDGRIGPNDDEVNVADNSSDVSKIFPEVPLGLPIDLLGDGI